MTRIMADATSANYGSIPAGVMRAGYVTGTPGIVWTPEQLASADVTIDQGYQSALPTLATVRDVEPGAWSISQAALLGQWTATRPTIYISLAMLPALEQAGWQGDVWLADWTGTPPPQPPPMPAGMRCVAVQYTNQGGGGAYDLSVVFDPDWPGIGDPPMAYTIQATGGTEIYLLDGGKMSHITDGSSFSALLAAGVKPVTVTPACLAQFLADYPPGNPPVTVTVTG